MARMDVSTAITKRRSLPRILSSSRKNSWLTTIENNPIKKELDYDESDSIQLPAAVKQEPDSNESEGVSTPCYNNISSSPSPFVPDTNNASSFTSSFKAEVKSEPTESDRGEVDNQEIRVNPMITVRRGPQVQLPSRRVMCQTTPTPSNPSNSYCTEITLTPNEMLMALVNLCAPAAEVEETPPQLEREAALEDELSTSSETTAREHHFEEERPVIKPTFKALGDHMNYTAEPPVDPLPLPVCSSGTIRQLSNDVGTPKTASTSQLTGMTPSRPQNSTGTYHITPKPDTKYPPMTLGGVIGIRRPRTTASQSTLNNNLTLDQLNPTLAEALAAMKNKTETAKQSTSHGTHSSSDGISGRRDSLPTRMSGPVKLEALTPLNSSYAGSSGCGHLVSFNGQTTEVPEEIRCHLCDYPMKLCIRKSKYKGEIREYAAYRCLRKGCQTFRSVRKVIEPDYPCARKRKTDDYYDGYNSSPYSIMRDAPNESMRLKLGESPLATDGSEGTLLYIPGKVTMDHVEQMQKFTISLLSSKTDSPAENVPRLLFAPVNMTADDIDAHLRTDEGQKKLQRILVNSPHQTPAKYSNEFPLSKPALSSTSSTAGAMPQLGQQVFNPTTCTSQVTVQPSSASSVCGNRIQPSISGLPPLFDSTHTDNIFTATTPSCGMSLQPRVPEIKSHYNTELIW